METMATADVWAFVHDERNRLADDLAELAVAQWQTASLCQGWDVHDVLAHLVDVAKTGRSAFVLSMIRARGNFDRANASGVARERCDDPLDTLKSFRDVAALTRTPPANRATRLVEAIVHGEDIRRPLGVAATYSTATTRFALSYQLRTSVAIGGGRERADGFRLVSSETGEAWGEGDVVQGTTLELLLSASGRPGRLTGEGAIRFGSAVV